MRNLVLLLALLALPAFSAPIPSEVEDRVNEAMADRRHDAAMVELRRAMAQAADPEQKAELGCLLGRVQRLAGQPDAAVQTLAQVPLERGCGRRAAYERADALMDLGRAEEAAALYAEAGTPDLGPDRDAEMAAHLVELAERVLKDPDLEDHLAAMLRAAALELTITEDKRLVLAMELGRLLLDRPELDGGQSGAVVPVLEAALLRGDANEEVRLLLARLSPSRARMALLADLPESPALLFARAEVASAIDQGWGAILWDALLSRFPESEEAKRARLELARTSARQGQIDDLEALLPALLRGEAMAAAEGLHLQARLLLASGEDARAIEVLTDYLKRFPSGAARAEVEQSLVAARTRQARRLAEKEPARAVEAYDALLREHPTAPAAADLAFEAGLAARAAGDLEGARARWQEVGARWPSSHAGCRALEALARSLAFDKDEPEAAIAWLREQEQQPVLGSCAAVERARLEEPRLDIESRGPQDPDTARVRLTTRNIEEIEVRLHRVDAEAFLRAGGTPESLPSLDVAVIAPDKRWKVSVPGYKAHEDLSWELPVRLPGPGLYAVTVATPAEEARAVLWASDIRLVGRAIGDDLVVAAFDGGQPAGGARVLVSEGDRVLEGRTDRSGLARFETEAPELILLAEHRQGPALLRLERDPGAAPEAGLRATVDLDRPVYRPGDRVGLRLLARRGDAPVKGEWELWVDANGIAVGHARAGMDERGLLQADLRLPDIALPVQQGGPERRNWSLMGKAPDGETTRLANLVVAEPDLARRDLDGEMQEDGSIVFTVTGPEGEPVEGVPLRWWSAPAGREGEGESDARGELKVPALPAGLTGAIQAEIPGTSLSARVRTEPEALPETTLDLEQDRISTKERARWRYQGAAGPARLVLRRQLQPPEDVPAPADPWVPEIEGRFEVGTAWAGSPPEEPSVVGVIAHTETLQVGPEGEASGALPTSLPPGRYTLSLSHAEGTTWTVQTSLVIEDGPGARIETPATALAGLPLQGRVAGGSALVTVTSDRLLGAAVLRPGDRLPWTPEPRWDGEVRISASWPGGEHERPVRVEGELPVTLEVVETAGRWTLRARVTDAAGRPVRAQVALSAIDERLVEVAGKALRSNGSILVDPAHTAGLGGARVEDWEHAAFSEPVAAALRQEELRRLETQRARAAAEGRFADNALHGLLSDETIIGGQTGFGGLGTRGTGAGGGGYGSGAGSIGGRVGGSARVVAPLPGLRQRILWAILETDASGRAELTLPGPPSGHAYEVTARALTRDAHGLAESRIEIEGPVEIPRQEAAPEIALTVTGSGDETLTRLALTPDRGARHQAVRAARAGRIAWALLPHVPAADRPALEAAIRTARDRVFLLPSSSLPGERAEQLLFLAEAKTLLGLTSGELAERAAQLEGAGQTTEERLLVLHARSAAGAEPDPRVLDRLLRTSAELSPEERRRLAEILDLVDRKEDAARVRAELGALSLSTELAPVGTAARVEQLRALAARLDLDPRAGIVLTPFRPPDSGPGPLALRLPAGLDGAPVHPRLHRPLPAILREPVEEESSALCGSASPCALLPGDALVLDADLLTPGWKPPKGIEVEPGPTGLLLRVMEPGQHRVEGLSRMDEQGRLALGPLVIDARSTDPLPLLPGAALALSAQLAAAGQDIEALLGPWPTLERWPAALRAEVARLRFAAALEGEAQALILRFEDLREAAPESTLELSQVATVARAYQQIGRHRRAVEAWRAGLGAAFLSESAPARALEDLTGTLSSLQAMRAVAARYPVVPVVEEALFQLPEQLGALADSELPPELVQAGVTATDLRLMAAAWDRSFLALHPDSPKAPEAGFHLVQNLLRLQAPAQAAETAARMAARYPESPLLDGFVYLEGISRADLGQDLRARALLRRVAEDEFPYEGGGRGPARLAPDARYALARLDEARGRLDPAKEGYREVSTAFPEAGQALAALERVVLVPEPLIRLEMGEPARLPIELANVDTLHLRAYRLDLATVFLRDGGLANVHAIEVSGVSPAWSGQRPGNPEPFPRERELLLPLLGPGAWLVQVDGGGQQATALLVRSGLDLEAWDGAGQRRLAVRRVDGSPAAGVEVRALPGGTVQASRTDLRGIAMVPPGAPALVFEGEHVAFTDPDEVLSTRQGYPQPAAAPARPDLLRNVDQRLEEQRSRNFESYEETFKKEAYEAIDANAL